jgi:hypothetical protein
MKSGLANGDPSATLETELLDRSIFRNKTDAKTALFRFIEGAPAP